MSDTQISAFISLRTRELVERYAEAHGVKKGHLIEEALRHHLQALRELPEDLVLPTQVVISPASFKQVRARVKKPARPTKAMRALMSGKPVAGEP